MVKIWTQIQENQYKYRGKTRESQGQIYITTPGTGCYEIVPYYDNKAICRCYTLIFIICT